MDVQNIDRVPAFTTKDGSEIRELLAYRNSAIRNQSLAEARLPVGGATQEHFHPRAEEIYYITHGAGKMRIENETRDVQPGDAIAGRRLPDRCLPVRVPGADSFHPRRGAPAVGPELAGRSRRGDRRGSSVRPRCLG